MEYATELLNSIDRSWKNLAAAWRKARARASEPSVHDFRVATRRLIAALELGQAVVMDGRAIPAERRLKKALKKMGPLRDIHVQKETLALVPESAVVKAYRQHLDRSKDRKAANVKDSLQRDNKRRIKQKMMNLRDDLERQAGKLTARSIRQPIERLLRSRQEDYMDAREKLETADEKALHAARIALKKLRYVAEAAGPVVEGWTPQVMRAMQTSQKLLGESHDIQVLMDGLKEWAAKKEKDAEPVLNHLERRRKRLVAQIAKSSRALDRVIPKRPVRPLKETTRAVKQLPQPSPAVEEATATEPLATAAGASSA